MTRYDDPAMVQFRLGGLIRQLSVPEFGAALGLYMEEFREENELHALSRHMYHVIVKRKENCRTCFEEEEGSVLFRGPNCENSSPSPIVSSRAPGRTVPNTSGPTLIAGRYIDWMFPQGISSMLSMRMIERHRGTYPHQYHLIQSTKKDAYEDIPDDVPPQHEDPPTQPPPPSRPVHAAASYADISERLTRFE
ncbi:hypothetical protein GOBAR_AA27636 [Gossypium barbadense]|uniref:Uncharacterized protein n=1 Tax=Gossypium barbadense TaxID=3634 RepID=A0A2P5WPM8_GOSBA|nr:hypothetical protein GOBAR_AA27636 [Gossypium barbadense]